MDFTIKKIVKYLPFIALFLLPLLFYPAVDRSSWVSNSDIHAMLEFASALLAVTAGVMVILHFFTTGRRFFLIISIGFLLIGAEEFVHAVFSLNRIWTVVIPTFKLAVSTTWLTGNLILAASFFTALILGEKEIVPAKRGLYAAIYSTIGLIFMTSVALLIFTFPSLPDFVQLGSISKKLIELSLALLFFIAFILYLGIYTQQKTTTPILWSILTFLILRVLVHIFILDSKNFYDAHWDTAHLMVFLSYFFPVFGVWGETVRIYKVNQLQVIKLEIEMNKRKQIEEALGANEKEFRSLAESMPQIVWTTRADGWYTYFNQQWLDYTGLALEESYGYGWNIPFHPEDKQKAWNAWQNAVNNNAIYSVESRIRRYDGTYQWWLVRGVPLISDDGKIVKWFGTCTDIERIKQIENELRESEEKYRNLFNNCEVGMYRTRLDGSEIMEFNEKYLKILGYTNEEVKGKPSKDMWANKLQREKMMQVLRAEGHVTDLECDLLTKNGDIINCITSAKLNPDEGFLEGSFHDITERQQTEKALKENEERLRDIIFSMGDWVWEVDQKGIYTHSSQQGTNILGFSRDEIVGKSPFDFMQQDEAGKIGELFSEIVANKAPIKDLENWNIGKNGQMICLLTNGVPLLDNEGNLKGYRGVDKDITEFKKNEAALKQNNEVMISLYQRLENIREDEQAQISRNIHDQLGQSLTALKFDLGALIDKTERGSAENVKLAGMIEMVTQIIRNVQRISSELRPPAFDELGLSASMEWYCEDLTERTGLQLHLELDNIQTKNMNKNLALYRVLQESLTNVVRHAGAKNIFIKLCFLGEDILLIIKDDGVGITPDKINSVKSLGILGMIERIRQFDGDIEISNQDKKGTEVKVRLSVK